MCESVLAFNSLLSDADSPGSATRVSQGAGWGERGEGHQEAKDRDKGGLSLTT